MQMDACSVQDNRLSLLWSVCPVILALQVVGSWGKPLMPRLYRPERQSLPVIRLSGCRGTARTSDVARTQALKDGAMALLAISTLSRGQGKQSPLFFWPHGGTER